MRSIQYKEIAGCHPKIEENRSVPVSLKDIRRSHYDRNEDMMNIRNLPTTIVVRNLTNIILTFEVFSEYT